MNTVVNPVMVSLAIWKLCQVHYSTVHGSVILLQFPPIFAFSEGFQPAPHVVPIIIHTPLPAHQPIHGAVSHHSVVIGEMYFEVRQRNCAARRSKYNLKLHKAVSYYSPCVGLPQLSPAECECVLLV
jgi:hypothetical protein